MRGHDDEEHEVIFAGVADDSIRAMLDILRREGDALSTLNEEHYQAIKDAYTNNIRLMTRFLAAPLPRRYPAVRRNPRRNQAAARRLGAPTSAAGSRSTRSTVRTIR